MSPPHQNGHEFNASTESNEGTTTKQEQQPWEGPAAQGLYDPENEHEACGVGFVVAIDGKRNHKVCSDSKVAIRIESQIYLTGKILFFVLHTDITRCSKIVVAYEPSWRMRLRQ